MIYHGVNPVKKDRRKYSFHRTFIKAGGVVAPTISTIPQEFDFDAGFGMPNQNADGLPYGCTGYTQSELGQDEFNVLLDPRYTYDQTLLMENIGSSDPEFEKQGCDVKDSLKSAIIYGLKPKQGGDPLTYRMGDYYDAVNGSGFDCFDSIRLAMYTAYLKSGKKKSVSVVTPWLSEFHDPLGGMIPTDFKYNGDPGAYEWHNWKISGFKMINGELWTKAKTWQGPGVGDSGWLYFSRATLNKLLAIPETSTDIFMSYNGQTIYTVKLTILAQIISYIRYELPLLLKKKVQ